MPMPKISNNLSVCGLVKKNLNVKTIHIQLKKKKMLAYPVSRVSNKSTSFQNNISPLILSLNTVGASHLNNPVLQSP